MASLSVIGYKHCDYEDLRQSVTLLLNINVVEIVFHGCKCRETYEFWLWITKDNIRLFVVEWQMYVMSKLFV